MNHCQKPDVFSGPEPFVDSDLSALMSDESIEEISLDEFKPSRPRKKKNKRRVLLGVLFALIGVFFCLLFLFLRHLSSNPSSLFQTADTVNLEISATLSPEPALLPAPTATPETSPDPYTALQQQADLSMMKDIVNVMLIGVDYAEERETWSGKNGKTAAHADTMIVLAVNFENNTADLISLPRDTFAKIPGVNGTYKLNASLDCGGGLSATNGAGFLKTCESASRMIGGISIPYYYAVTMPAVKALVDSIGGVNFDLDVSFKIQGRSYKKGLQHMDGQAVLDYLRVRKSGSGLKSDETGDSNRVNRQKRMLVAIFDKIKSEGMMTRIPELLNTMSETLHGNFFTNCTVSQTAALALYACNMPTENIRMHSMSGSMKNLFSWNFCFPKPSLRREIIREVYGISAPDLLDCTLEYAEWQYSATVADQYAETCADLTSYLKKSVDVNALAYEDESGSLPVPEDSPVDPDDPFIPEGPYIPDIPDIPDWEEDDSIPVIPEAGNAAFTGTSELKIENRSVAFQRLVNSEIPVLLSSRYDIYTRYMETYDYMRTLLKDSRAAASKYLRGESNTMGKFAEKLTSACEDLRLSAEEAAAAFGYNGVLDWEILKLADTNEIYVDFR